MRRRFATWLCGALLLWAAFDDVLAAQTPEPDDDLAAALDNDYVQLAPVRVLSRAVASVPLAGDIDIPVSSTTAFRRDHSFRLADPLYLFMSLQR
jgi:hypothetical protein